MDPTNNRGWECELRKGKQFILHMACYSCCKAWDKTRMRKGSNCYNDKGNISVDSYDTDLP